MRRSKQVFERVTIFLQKVYGTGYLFRQMVSKELRSWTSGRSLPVWKYCSVPPLRGPDLMIHVFPVRLLHDGQFSDEKSLYYNFDIPRGNGLPYICPLSPLKYRCTSYKVCFVLPYVIFIIFSSDYLSSFHKVFNAWTRISISTLVYKALIFYELVKPVLHFLLGYSL